MPSIDKAMRRDRKRDRNKKVRIRPADSGEKVDNKRAWERRRREKENELYENGN